jgi:predicted AAA+ superfamily ATPase
MFQRSQVATLLRRLEEPRRFIQVLTGPRQSGKTTIARQVVKLLKIPVYFISADEPGIPSSFWIEEQWNTARVLTKGGKNNEGVLILDEVQKIPHWSQVIKKLWDEDAAGRLRLKVVLLGSAPLLIQKGLTESLAGRFEVIPVTHWSYDEMHNAFGWDVNKYIFYGGYPGSASLINNYQRWSDYILHSLVETTIARDVLLLTRVDKPALMRQLFSLGCRYSGQIISYQKMLGQLQDAGNTTTLAHYLELLTAAGMLTGLHKYYQQEIRRRGSSPKLQVLNTALLSAQLRQNFESIHKQNEVWGRLVESAVGAHLINASAGKGITVTYWREGDKEVDFVLQKGKTVTAIEVKSEGRQKSSLGIELFARRFKPKNVLLVGGRGIPLKNFFITDVEELVR